MTDQKHYPMPELSEQERGKAIKDAIDSIASVRSAMPFYGQREDVISNLQSELYRQQIALAALTAPKAEPITFDSLRDTVAEVTGGLPHEWGEGHKGHEAVPFMNFNSLMRLVKSYHTTASEVK